MLIQTRSVRATRPALSRLFRIFLGIVGSGLLAACVQSPGSAAFTGLNGGDHAGRAALGYQRAGILAYANVESANVEAFSNVTQALAGTFLDLSGVKPCRDSLWRSCPIDDWQALLQDLRGKSRTDQLESVNRFVNRARYVPDQRNYGVADRWATARQLFERGGDCEDYVLTKYVSLRALGIPAEDLRITVVYDRLRRIGHAILLVQLDGRIMVLDNQSSRILRADQITRYRPLYSINEARLWLHPTLAAPDPIQDAANAAAGGFPSDTHG